MGRRSRATGIAAVVVAMLGGLGAAVEGNQLIATVERPATVTVSVAQGPDSIEAGQYVVVDVTAYTPPRDGVVQGVVTVQKNTDGTEQEIGRFGIFPNTEFSAADPSKVRRYSFPLPRDVLQRRPCEADGPRRPAAGRGRRGAY